MKKKEQKTNKSTTKKKSSGASNIILGLIIFIGLGIIAYPTVSDWWNQRHATKAIATYVEQVEQMSDASLNDILNDAYAYNDNLPLGIDFTLSDEEMAVYEDKLDISGTGIMGYIDIPKINVNLPIYHGISDEVLEIAVGHIPGSSLPVGGKGTHAVLSGHRGLPTATLFSDLDQIGEGDVFTVTILNQVLTYQVDQIRIVLPEDVSELSIEPGKDYVTLVTCTPYGVNSHRMLVRGTRIDNLEGEHATLVVSEARKLSPTFVICGIAIPLIMVAMLISFFATGMQNWRRSQDKILEELENASRQAGGDNNEN